MAYYGTFVLAKPTAVVLPAQPEVRQGFGSRFGVPGPWGNSPVGLYDLGAGWQRVGVTAFYSERLRVAAGTEALTAATGAPAMAAYVSESSCVHLEARTPSGTALSLHLPNTDAPCESQHLDGTPGRVEPHVAVAGFERWAEEAGRTATGEHIAAILDGTWNGSPFMEDAVLAIIAALAFPSGTLMLPVIDPDDAAFEGFAMDIARVDSKASARIHLPRQGYVLGPEFELTPRDLDYLRFRERLWGSIYGGGATRAELLADYEQLMARWKA